MSSYKYMYFFWLSFRNKRTSSNFPQMIICFLPLFFFMFNASPLKCDIIILCENFKKIRGDFNGF